MANKKLLDDLFPGYGTFSTSQPHTERLKKLLSEARYLVSKDKGSLSNIEEYNTKVKQFKLLVDEALKDLKNGHIGDKKEMILIQHCAKFAKQLEPRIAALDAKIASLKK